MPYICEFCNKELSSKHSMNIHNATAKYCIDLRKAKGINVSNMETNFSCPCGKKYTRNWSLHRHQINCNIAKKSLNNEEDSNEDKNSKSISIPSVNIVNNEDNKNNSSNINNGTINTNSNNTNINTNSNNTTNNIININTNLFTMENLTQDWIVEKLTPVLTQAVLKQGINAVVELIIQVVLNRDGHYCYWCTDRSRQKFRMLLNHDGEAISKEDPDSRSLRSLITIPLLMVINPLMPPINYNKTPTKLDRIYNSFKNLDSTTSDDFNKSLARKLPNNSDMEKKIEKGMQRIEENIRTINSQKNIEIIEQMERARTINAKEISKNSNDIKVNEIPKKLLFICEKCKDNCGTAYNLKYHECEIMC